MLETRLHFKNNQVEEIGEVPQIGTVVHGKRARGFSMDILNHSMQEDFDFIKQNQSKSRIIL